jgi:uncharacterized membrane-anchored protein YhcB (DUF1043 family)
MFFIKKRKDIPMKHDSKPIWIATIVKDFGAICQQMHEKLEDSAPSNLLADAEKLAIEKMRNMTCQIQQQAIQHEIDERTSQRDYRLCRCGQRMRHRGIKQRQFITKAGSIELSGIYLHCKCGNTKPIKQFVSGHSTMTPQATELIVRYAGSMPYRTSGRYLKDDFGIKLSHETVKQIAVSAGHQIARVRNENSDVESWEKLDGQKLYGYADGVLINVNSEGWKECKLLRFEPEDGSEVRFRAVLGNVDRFGRTARREVTHLKASLADEIVFLMDGAKGLANHIEKNLPMSRLIVDYWHVCQHISECAGKLYPDDPAKAEKWRKKYCHMLREEGPVRLLKSLSTSKRHRDDEQVVILSKLINFIKPRVRKIDYPKLIADGYRVDSGPIESACKNVVQARMKMAGMRWSRVGAVAMLEVRTALMSDLWKKTIRQIAA